jgi:hypothetical protein
MTKAQQATVQLIEQNGGTAGLTFGGMWKRGWYAGELDENGGFTPQVRLSTPVCNRWLCDGTFERACNGYGAWSFWQMRKDGER